MTGKLVADETLTKFQLYEIQIDWKEEHDRANEMPEKTAELKALLLETWQGIVEEGPNQWWEDHSGPEELKRARSNAVLLRKQTVRPSPLET